VRQQPYNNDGVYIAMTNQTTTGITSKDEWCVRIGRGLFVCLFAWCLMTLSAPTGYIMP